MNGKIRNLPWVKQLFVQPAANDAGQCVGAAYLGAAKLNDPIEKIENVYLGPDLERESVEKFLASTGVQVQKTERPYEIAAKRIVEGKTVGWMQGRLEFGPRALGHRSLLADPRKMEMKDRLNEIKNREGWRPIAPALISVDGKRYFDDRVDGLEYMAIAVPMNDHAIKEIPAGVHVDQTARVQVVRNTKDPFYKLIDAFYQATGVPAILNTSLNGKDEPLCATIQDGVKFFYTTPTDDLFVNDFWLTKR